MSNISIFSEKTGAIKILYDNTQSSQIFNDFRRSQKAQKNTKIMKRFTPVKRASGLVVKNMFFSGRFLSLGL
jgi:hypothetical protein